MQLTASYVMPTLISICHNYRSNSTVFAMKSTLYFIINTSIINCILPSSNSLHLHNKIQEKVPWYVKKT